MESASVPSPKNFVKTSPDLVGAGLFLLAGACVFLAWAPDTLYILLALHVLAIVAWVGGDIALTTLGIVFEAKKDGADARRAREDGRVDRHAGLHAGPSFLAFGFGVALMEKYSIPPGVGSQFWVLFAVCRLVDLPRRSRESASSAPSWAGSARLRRRSGRTPPRWRRRVKRLFTIFRFDTALLALIVIDMVAKPTF